MRCTRQFSLTLATTVAVLGSVSTAHAQAQTVGTRFGVEAALADTHLGLGLGAFVKFHLADMNSHPITGRGSFDFFFPGDLYYGGSHYYQIAADGLYDIANPNSTVKPYVGAGLSFSTFSNCVGGCSGLGLDLVGGVNFMANSRLMPFAEVKLVLGGAGDVGYGSGVFMLKGGIHF